GLSGLFNDALVSRYYQLRVQPLGEDVTALSIQSKVTLTTTDPTVSPQLLDMQIFVAGPSIGAGVLVPSVQYQQTFVDKNYDDLAKKSNCGWFVDQFKTLNFQSRQAIPAPWVLSSNTLMQPSDIEADSNLLVEVAGDLYRNRQILRNVIYSIVATDDFIGDNSKRSFTLSYPVAPGTIPVITLNSLTQTIAQTGN